MATAEPQYVYAELIAAIRKEMTATNLVSYCIGHAAKGKVQMNIVGKKGERKERNLKNPVAQVPNHFILVERPPEKMVSE